ncbi:ABC transporter permease [Verminephrobacter aporrectodeae]|uniref:Transport permease protein n=1 Tax=Verminephrobacter aporrectodeae subsp. tuberculatae TaxID=1110392 RepID=A0ABT3KT67_9BURK|nr:ABC transporter permease [Verminephrobacter aporrectodeae]MCW5222497.1 ABC transporter [Verminephrobacter aporrectodeae subsp. tuberculatae]MCW5257293.1 ABC transporter [Verminephrobacter aporrectodeae subsp. tuberculatae]MCW5287962.1 ABC transporter [Verminephrobacter aporrectodeae subsp. tuberculatae]MCW5321522.1 ABC transporter [Verminephrobacter aporrectodeae subsp. tuberculatae]MCW8166428.1 ABC transporter [Verminephrobacter aporrectodeae subsp. tuberculatae]
MTRAQAHFAAPSRSARQWWVLWRYWMLREFKTRYAGSVLGWVWAFVQPVASLAIFYVLFGLVLAVRVPGLDANHGYLLHLLAGLAVWLPFTDAIGRGVGCLAAYEDFLRKQPMPAEILPAVSVGGSLLVLAIGHALLLALCVAQGLGPRASWAWLPLLLLAQLALTYGLTLLLSMAHFLWRDVGSMVAFALQLWFYLTPVVYPLSQVPERFHGWFLFNPLACLVLMLQGCVLGLPVVPGAAWALAAWVLLLGAGGWYFFRSMKPALGEAL